MAVIKLDTLTYPKIKKLLDNGNDSLLFPIGTLEAHGRHAPVGTDNFCAENIAWELAERLGWPVAPTLNYGITTGLIAYPGSVRISKEVYTEVLSEILEDFFAMGFRRIVLVNGHGGNTETVGKLIKELIVDDRGNRHMILIDWWQLGSEALAEVYNRPGGHAALDETACIVAYRPETLEPSEVDEMDITLFQPGVQAAPYSAAIIAFEAGDPKPDFDADKAKVYMTKVLDKVESVIRKETELFERSFGG